jgi:predicted RNA-binding protein (virulence factor B family)
MGKPLEMAKKTRKKPLKVSKQAFDKVLGKLIKTKPIRRKKS